MANGSMGGVFGLQGSRVEILYGDWVGNSTNNYGWFGGGFTASAVTTVDKITFATDTNTASVRGSLSVARQSLAVCSDGSSNGWFGGGNAGGYVSTVDKIAFATDTNTASVRGSLSLARQSLAAV